MKRLPRFISKLIPNYEVTDVKEWLSKGHIDVYLKKTDFDQPCLCSKCSYPLGNSHGKYPVKLKAMPIFNFKTNLIFWREKRFCSNCKKVRAEKLDFISEETPHLTKEYAWWLGRLCEITPISRAAEFTGNDQMTMYRLDLERMRRMFQDYKIPPVKRISVDEVYARSKKYHAKESRDRRFFTIVSDLDTRRVVWVSESRNKAALDEFFQIIGIERCAEIEVVAGDQHDPYKASVNEHCPNAVFVWDRFHIMQTFETAVNEDRAWLSQHACKDDLKRLTRSKFKSLFIKKAERRNKEEQRHIKTVLKDNEHFVYLEIIKEGMFEIFDSKDALEARERFDQLGKWIEESEFFYTLSKWWKNFDQGWNTFKNYFKHRVSSSLSEGINNVIKTVKKRAYGYRNMHYFKLKILQVCGYLNSRYVPMNF